MQPVLCAGAVMAARCNHRIRFNLCTIFDLVWQEGTFAMSESSPFTPYHAELVKQLFFSYRYSVSISF